MAYYTPSFEQAVELKKSGLLTTADAADWYIRTRIPAMRYNKAFSGMIDTFAVDPAHGLTRNYTNLIPVIAQLNDIGLRGYFSASGKTVKLSELNKWDCETEYHIGIENGYSEYRTYFKKFFDLAASHKIPIIVYSSPWPEKARNCKNFHIIMDFYDHMIKDLAAGNPYIHFVDYDYFWPNEYMADLFHLNQKGADKISKLAVGWVRSVHAFPELEAAHNKPARATP